MFSASANGKVSEVIRKLQAIGFTPVTGKYDFEFQWTKDPKIEEIAVLGNNIQRALKDAGVMFKLETVSDKIVL